MFSHLCAKKPPNYNSDILNHNLQFGICVVVLLNHVWCFCDPWDCSPPGSFVQGISQAKLLEHVAISFSKGSSWSRLRDRTMCPALARGFFTTEPPGSPYWDLDICIFWKLHCSALRTHVLNSTYCLLIYLFPFYHGTNKNKKTKPRIVLIIIKCTV